LPRKRVSVYSTGWVLIPFRRPHRGDSYPPDLFRVCKYKGRCVRCSFNGHRGGPETHGVWIRTGEPGVPVSTVTDPLAPRVLEKNEAEKFGAGHGAR